jgi:hypothetical protein
MVRLQRLFDLVSSARNPAQDPCSNEATCGPPVPASGGTSNAALGTTCTSHSLATEDDTDNDMNVDWKHAVRFPSEAQRMAVLQSLQVLHTEPEQRFDTITR